MRLLALALLALPLGCSSIPTEHGRAWLVGDVAWATAGPDGTCSIDVETTDRDFGKDAEDVGKHKTAERTVRGGAHCYDGSGVSENLRLLAASVLSFLVGLGL